MLPFDQKRLPRIVDDRPDDLMSAGKKSALAALMKAFKSDDIEGAYEALEDLLALCDTDD